MSLVKRTYVDQETVITAENLNAIQDAIIENEEAIEDQGEAIEGKYSKPAGGIPATDMASGVQTSLGKADSAYQKPSGGIPASDMASGVQTSLGKAESAYQKPSGGIPASDMASGVQTSLGKAESAYQKPSGGIPATDMASGVQTSLGKADSAYQKPSGGIPATDMASGVQTSLGKADSSYQKPSGGIPASDMASAVQTSLGKADSAYQKPSGGIPSTDLASAVQTSLGKADTALQSSDIDSTLAVTEKAADAKKTGDEISDVKNTLTHMENGVNENMTAGNAMQLDSYTYAEDQEPYLFRKTGGSVEAGNREDDCIVGATVAWNQLVTDGNFTSSSNWAVSGGSISVANNKCTFTSSTSSSGLTAMVYQRLAVNIISGHKYLNEVTIKSSLAGSEIRTNLQNNGRVAKIASPSADVEYRISGIVSASVGGGCDLRVGWEGSSSVGATLEISNFVLFDLTQMFGSAIADRAYALEQATAGSGIAWLKSMGFFTNDYYAYDAGSLQSVKVGAKKTVGKNQVFRTFAGYVSPGVNEAIIKTAGGGTTAVLYVKEGLQYTISSSGALNRCVIASVPSAYPTNNYKTYRFVSLSDNTRTWTATFTGWACWYAKSSYDSAVADSLQIELGSFATVYEPYIQHTYPLDTTKEWRGILKLDANNKVYADGDIYPPSGEAKRRYAKYTFAGNEDLIKIGTGTTGWYEYAFTITGADEMPQRSDVIDFCTDYGQPIKSGDYVINNIDRIYVYRYGKDIRWTLNVSTNDAALALLSGKSFVYELATPTTESALPYQTPQICAADGTEEYADYAVAAGTRDVAVPVGHLTKYPEDLRAKIEGLPWNLSMIAPIENGTTASQAYTTGQYFLHNDLFCKALTSIASGATFTLNTNYAVTTVAAELYAAINS